MLPHHPQAGHLLLSPQAAGSSQGRGHSPFREAQWLAAKLDLEFGRIVASVKDDTKTPNIQRIAREYLKAKLEGDMEYRAASPHIGVYSRSAEPGRIMADDLEWIDGELQTARTELHERLYEHQRPLIDWVMEENAIPAEFRGAVAHAILQANVTFWETVRERTLGNFSNEPRDLEGAEPLPSSASNVSAGSAPTGPRLSEVLPGFLALMSEQGVWRGQTLAQNTATYDMFIECCGDRAVTSYERKDLARFFDLLRGLPKLYSKSAQWKGLPIAEIVEQTKEQDHERLSITTMKRHFSAVTSSRNGGLPTARTSGCTRRASTTTHFERASPRSSREPECALRFAMNC